jgi:putative transposase
MSKSKQNTEQIIGALKQVEAGRTVAEMAREVGVSVHTIYAWKAKYGGMEVNEAEELRSLREENQRLKSPTERNRGGEAGNTANRPDCVS